MNTTKQGEMAQNGAVRIKSNQIKIKIKSKSKSNQIKSNQIKSNQIKSNQKSNPKQDFKLKPVSNAFSGYL